MAHHMHPCAPRTSLLCQVTLSAKAVDPWLLLQDYIWQLLLWTAWEGRRWNVERTGRANYYEPDHLQSPLRLLYTSALLWETHLSWVDTILVGLSVRSAALLWLGLVQDSRRAGHVFSTWTLNGLIRAKELTHSNCQHPKVGAFPSSCLRTAWSPTPWDFQAFFQFCRLLYNSSNSSLFQLTRFSFYCSQSRNQKDTKPLFHGPLSHPVFQLFQSHEMIWDNDKCVPGV